MKIIHDQDNHKFSLVAPNGSRAGEIAYAMEDGNLLATHTRVLPEYRGQGLAEELLDHLVTYARDEGLKIVPLCSYVIAAFEKDPAKYATVVKS